MIRPIPRPEDHHPTNSPDQTITALIDIIKHGIENHPRSLQTTIGPSEIGNPCDHCLAARLAGWPKVETSTPWLPTIGTAVHGWLETEVWSFEIFGWEPDPWTGPSQRFHPEKKVTVGTIDGQPITGSCDVFDYATGTVVDWKVVGDTTLRDARTGPSPTYSRQVHLYGKGWEDKGYTVNTVMIAFLPRNSTSLRDAHWWHEPYSRQVAVEALDRAGEIASTIRTLQQTLGNTAADAWITGLPRAIRCWDCQRYSDRPTKNAFADITTNN
jgi:hypothetical protein